jgi:hypothetical protein
MNDILPIPKPRKYEYRGSTCPKHANRCAERRYRHTQGPYECVFCVISANAAALLATPLDPALTPERLAALTQEGQETP